MDNTKVIKTIEKYAFHQYLEKLIAATMHRITLFTIFKQTGAPNLSDPTPILIVDDLEKIAELNSGSYFN
ncbi:MAG: hypothetical protein ABIH22_02545 [Candidatus Margulisiibacteriota bacterium]